MNAFGDVIGADGEVLAGPRGEDGEIVSDRRRMLAAMTQAPDWSRLEERNTTLVCVITDAALDKPACTRVARMASGGSRPGRRPGVLERRRRRRLLPCFGGSRGAPDRFTSIAIGSLAATVTAAAIRDVVDARR